MKSGSARRRRAKKSHSKADFVKEVKCFRLGNAEKCPPSAASLISLIPVNFDQNLLFPLIFKDTPPPQGGCPVNK